MKCKSDEVIVKICLQDSARSLLENSQNVALWCDSRYLARGVCFVLIYLNDLFFLQICVIIIIIYRLSKFLFELWIKQHVKSVACVAQLYL